MSGPCLLTHRRLKFKPREAAGPGCQGQADPNVPGGRGAERRGVGSSGMPGFCHLALPPPSPHSSPQHHDDGQEEVKLLKIT